MVRSASPMLGGILLLAGVNLVHADGLYAPDASSDMSVWPATYGVFSRVPENWSDLPFHLQLEERTGYNSNVINTPQTSTGGVTVFGHPVGSLVSISSFGATTTAYWEGQQFFANGALGMYRYSEAPSLNSMSHSLNVGDRWTYGSKCSGQLIASERTSPAEVGQQVGFNVQNSVTAVALNETAKCVVTGNYALLLNSGLTSSTNSAALDKFNDYRSVFIEAGISYSVSETNSLQFLASVTGTDYSNRSSASNDMGLSSNIVEDELDLSYTKNLSPDLAVTASVGLIGARNGSFSLEPAKGFQPIYSAQVSWAATPKLKLTGAFVHNVSPPTSILANLEVSETANFGLTYALTPKVTLAAGVSTTRSSGFGGSSEILAGNSILQQFAQNERVYSANASLNYAITPFVAANVSYTHTSVEQSGFMTPTDVVLVALSFSPH